jgi:hypothetical protein
MEHVLHRIPYLVQFGDVLSSLHAYKLLINMVVYTSPIDYLTEILCYSVQWDPSINAIASTICQ